MNIIIAAWKQINDKYILVYLLGGMTKEVFCKLNSLIVNCWQKYTCGGELIIMQKHPKMYKNKVHVTNYLVDEEKFKIYDDYIKVEMYDIMHSDNSECC